MILTVNKKQWEDVMQMYVDSRKDLDRLREEIEELHNTIEQLNAENVDLVIENTKLRAQLEE